MKEVAELGKGGESNETTQKTVEVSMNREKRE